MPALRIQDLEFSYSKTTPLLRSISLHLASGQFGVLLGGSGSGKTSLLRCIAGFEKPHRGEIRLGDKLLTQSGRRLEARGRSVGFLFQNLALFPHLSLTENISYGLHFMSEDEAQAETDLWLERIQLKAHRHKKPHELSGGEKQRVALARALAPRPALLLMDEPFSSLDPDLRRPLRRDIRELIKSQSLTTLMVTHDHEEAAEMADEVGVLKNGELLSWGPRDSLFVQEDTKRWRLNLSGSSLFF